MCNLKREILTADKRPVIGHHVNVNYNDTFMFDDDDPNIQRCNACGCRADFEATNPNYVLKRRRIIADEGVKIRGTSLITATYDACLIVDNHFKEFCESQRYAGMRFVALPKDPQHFHMLMNQMVHVDEERAGLRRLEFCTECLRYAVVVGDSKNVTETGILADGFYRRNIALGSGDRKGYGIFVGLDTPKRLKEAGLIKSNIYNPVYACPNPKQAPTR